LCQGAIGSSNRPLYANPLTLQRLFLAEWDKPRREFIHAEYVVYQKGVHRLTIQFLDVRLSEHMSRVVVPPIAIDKDKALFIGDLGVQTLPVVGTANQANVRVWLSGVVNIVRPADVMGLTPSLRLFIMRNGDGTPASGTMIYEMFYRLGTLQFTSSPISITASDFPSSSIVSQGQIRYSLFIIAFTLDEVSGLYVQGPVAFNGMAVAGSN